MNPDERVVYETEVDTAEGKVRVELIVSESTLETVAWRGITAVGSVGFRATPVED